MDIISHSNFKAPVSMEFLEVKRIRGDNNWGAPLNILGGVTVTAAGSMQPQIIINPKNDGNENVTINGKVLIQSSDGQPPSLSIDSVDHRIDVGEKIWSTKSINTSDSITAEGNISACGTITACGKLTAKTITSQCTINTGDLTVSGILSGGTINVSGDIITSAGITGGTIRADTGIMLSGETITSWAELKGPAGPSILRFTSPEVPANCSQFYFEGCNLVTRTELPFIQVRETATGKLVQMDVWVNLDGCCSGFTVGKPVANIEPCSTATEAGAWTAIVMN